MHGELPEAFEGLTIRRARQADLTTIVAMLADDTLGTQREQAGTQLLPAYEAAFAAIDADANNELVVAEVDGALVGTFQLTFIPSLSYQGGTRAQIEAVRVAQAARGQGIGQLLIGWAIARARQKGCRLVQLTTNKRRIDAQRFYQRLGFVASHEGMKLEL